MTDNNKKRGSFRKIFPILFFSSKGKQKSIKDAQTYAKMNAISSTSKDNPYQNPRSIIERYENGIEKTDEIDERIYENLSTVSHIQNINESNDTSSSSTLVSENVTNRHHRNVESIAVANEQGVLKYIARPQVPPRPQNDVLFSSSVHYTQNDIKSNQYPDVYYHSLEKLGDNISPIDDIEIYKASRGHIQPASVGAEIKKVSTKFLISPKKEAEVRKMQPTRARSLSLDKKKPINIDNTKKGTYKTVEKPYNYSAPTSPVAVNHKIPNMPATVSPYEHVRKTMIEAEERRNSLSRSSSRNKSTPSPMPFCTTKTLTNDVTTTAFEGDSIKKEKTRKRVEAFYWQKIKEMKIKEDEYLLRQSLNNGMTVPRTNLSTYSNSNCSTPISFITDSRSSSLPRGREINQSLYCSPFTRGALERRTDSFINTKTLRTEPHIVYRHPEKLQANASKPNLPIFQRGSLTRDTRNVMQQQAKRVSFEEQPILQKTVILNPDVRNSEPMTLVASRVLRNPPQPPVRTSSAVSVNKNILSLSNHKNKVIGGPRFLCSESESGSEAGEIQRIMQSNGRKGSEHALGKVLAVAIFISLAIY